MKNEDTEFNKLFDRASLNYLKGKCEVRHASQRLMLYNLLDKDWDAYCELEDAIMYLRVRYCPSDREECQYLLSLYRVHLFVDELHEGVTLMDKYPWVKRLVDEVGDGKWSKVDTYYKEYVRKNT